ncbi:MAG TPA: hypothetical protein PKH33_14015 [bacterium]|nr:hypothetical protein [bacterium]
MLYSGRSDIQQEAEKEILVSLAKVIGVDFDKIQKKTIQGVELDGYVGGGEKPICIEIWAHQGKAKSAQKNKVMNDVCKLILFEKLCKRKCRKIFCVSDKNAISFLEGKGWQGQFVKAFDIEKRVVDIPDETRNAIIELQKKQNMYKKPE